MAEILMHVTEKGVGLPQIRRAHALDAGFDGYAADDVTFEPFGRAQVSLGFTYRLKEPFVVRDGETYARTLEVVKKGSGPMWFEPQAIIFDAGFQPPLDDPDGIKLIVANHSASVQTIKRGQKVVQLVMREVLLPTLVFVTLDELRMIPPPDTRHSGRFGSTDN